MNRIAVFFMAALLASAAYAASNQYSLVNEDYEAILYDAATENYAAAVMANLDVDPFNELVVVGQKTGPGPGFVRHGYVAIYHYVDGDIVLPAEFFYETTADEDIFKAVAVSDADQDGTNEVIAVGEQKVGLNPPDALMAIIGYDGVSESYLVETTETWSFGADTHATGVEPLFFMNAPNFVDLVVVGYSNNAGPSAFVEIFNWNGAVLTSKMDTLLLPGGSTTAQFMGVDGLYIELPGVAIAGITDNCGVSPCAYLGLYTWDGAANFVALDSDSSAIINKASALAVAVGDMNNDEVPDYTIAGEARGAGDPGAGYAFARIYTYSGALATLATNTWRDGGIDAQNNAVAVSDVDGDSKNEFVTAGFCCGDINGVEAQIKVNGYSGGITQEAFKKWRFDPTAESDTFGLDIFDVDQDGYVEIVGVGRDIDNVANAMKGQIIVTQPRFAALNVPVGVTLRTSGGVDISSTPQLPGTQTIYAHVADGIAGRFEIAFGERDVDFAGFVADRDNAARKVYMYDAVWDAKVDPLTRYIYIPGLATPTNQIRFCPAATDFDTVTTGCAGGSNEDGTALWNPAELVYIRPDPGVWSGGMEIGGDNPPTVALDWPTDDEEVTSLTVGFNFTAVDDYGFDNCSLWDNTTGAWGFDTLNQSAVVNDSTNTITKTFAGSGAYLWNVQCCDNASQCEFAPGNLTVIVNYSGGGGPGGGGVGVAAAPEFEPGAVMLVFGLAILFFVSLLVRKR